MNQIAPSSSHVGVATGGSEGMAVEPIRLPADKVRAAGVKKEHILLELDEQQFGSLTQHLTSRLAAGRIARDRRVTRYGKIDKLISTWQQLSPEDSQREAMEDNTGRNQALPMNLPILSSHLNDMTSYFAEALAPVSNPFFSASGEEKYKNLLAKFNRDAAARNYFGELSLVIRSLLKYNLGGFLLTWDSGMKGTKKYSEPGNHWRALDLYNTFWDPSIRKPDDVATKGEWAGMVCMENRLEVIKKAISGEWVGLEDVASKAIESNQRTMWYREPAVEAQIGQDGLDTRTTQGKNGGSQPNWGAYGMGLATDLGPEVDGFEVTTMYCWLVPAQFGLLTQIERDEINAQENEDAETFLELWRFNFVGDKLVNAEPAMDRKDHIAGELCVIPLFIAYLVQDQLNEAQRSFMELMKGFQRFGSSMYNIYIAGMRKNVWGLTVVDDTIVDTSNIKKGDTAGIVRIKKAGSDVRAAFQTSTPNAGVDAALTSVENSLALKDRFFPSQALPSQIAGIDRAVKSQVSTVVHGSVRAIRTILRVLDSSLMLPTRMAAYRNLKKNDKDGIEDVNDEDMAKMLGSGIESMEAERVSEILWQLMYAIIQNQEAMMTFDVPKMLTYLGRVGNLSVDLGDFAKNPQQAAAPAGAPAVDPTTGQPIQQPPPAA